MKIAIALSTLAVLTVSTLSASALPSESGTEVAVNPAVDTPTAMPLTRGEGRGKGLNLTDEQREQIFSLKNKLKDDLGPKKAELQKERRSLQDLLTQQSLDKGAIQKTNDRINALKNEMSNRFVAFAMDFNEQLTPEQRETIRYKKMQRSSRGHGHHHRRHSRSGHGPSISTESGGAVTTSMEATGNVLPGSINI